MNDLKDARRCAFRIGERRCRAPGNSTHTTRADSKTLWYCMSHFNDSRRGEIGLALMDEIDREWAERQAAWQNDPRHPNDKAVKAWIDGHPELKKRPDDDKFSHIYRCLAALPPGFHGQKERLQRVVDAAEAAYRKRENPEPDDPFADGSWRNGHG